MGFLLLKYELPFSLSNQLASWEEIKISLDVHETRIIKFDVCKDLDVEITLVITFFSV
jgi:hypothetical protein